MGYALLDTRHTLFAYPQHSCKAVAHYAHFVNEEIETDRVEITCKKSYSCEW